MSNHYSLQEIADRLQIEKTTLNGKPSFKVSLHITHNFTLEDGASTAPEHIVIETIKRMFINNIFGHILQEAKHLIAELTSDNFINVNAICRHAKQVHALSNSQHLKLQ